MKFEIEWRGEKYLTEWLGDVDFEKLDNVTQSYGFIFDKEGRVCVVDCDKGYWSLPGGAVEAEDKSYEDTLRREADGEADLILKNIRKIGCFRVTLLDKKDSSDVHHVLRYVAEVEKINKQTVDPCNGKIAVRKFVRPEEFNDYVKWGESGDFQIERALEVFGG